MKALIAALALSCVAVPAGAVSFVIDGTHGGDVAFDGFDSEIAFTMAPLGGPVPVTFTASFSGLITADPRYCSDFPPDDQPADCRAAIDPILAEDSFTAYAGSAGGSLFLPFSLSGTGEGHMHFSATDGGTLRIDIANATLVDAGTPSGSGNATPAPEPASWAMMLSGFAFVGGVMRLGRRKRVGFASPVA